MASVINTNMASLYAQKNLTGAQSALSTAVERLSSGLRINRAKDDAAGLGISEKITSQVNALNQGVRNANDAISMVQTAEGSLAEVSSMLQRMKELAVQARNESLSAEQTAYIAEELLSLRDEINAVSNRTTFNGKSLLKNALTAQISSAVTAGALSNGATVFSGLTVQNVSALTANVGTYSVSVRNEVEEYVDGELFVAASNVVDEPVPVVDADSQPIGANSSRILTINAGDVFEGSKLSVRINGDLGDITYSVVAGQDSTATTLRNQLLTKLERDYGASVSSTSTNQITFAAGAGVGLADITVSNSYLQNAGVVTNVASTVDGPFQAQQTDRNIVISDFDVQEGRRFTVRVGNPNTYAEFSVIAGAGDTKANIAANLKDLIEEQYTGVSVSGSTITFDDTTDQLGQALISLEIQNTSTVDVGLTISSISDKYGVSDQTRSIEIIDADVDPGRIFSLTVDGKEYAYKAVDGDTDATVAYNLATLVQQDYSSVAGTVSAPTLSGTSVYETDAVTFLDMAAGDTLSVAGLWIQARTDLTAAQVAQAFSNLSAGAASAISGVSAATSSVYGSGGNAPGYYNDNVIYSGTLAGWSTGAADGDTVVFTNASAGAQTNLSTPTLTAVSTSTFAVAPLVKAGAAEVPADTIESSAAGDTLTLTGHKYVTGDRVTFDRNAAANSDNLVDGATYYVIRVDKDTIKLATSAADATAGTAVDLDGDLTATTARLSATVGSNDERVVVTFGTVDMQVGDQITFDMAGDGTDEVTFTATQRIDTTDFNDLAAAIQAWWMHGTSSNLGTFSGTASNTLYTAAIDDQDDTALIFTSTDPGANKTDADIGTTNVTASGTTAFPDDLVVNTAASSTEAYDAAFSTGMSEGDSITVGGLRFTANSAISAAQTAEAFKGLFDGATYGAGVEYGSYSGMLRGWTSGSAAGTTVTFTSVTAATNVENLTTSAIRVSQDISRSDNVLTFATSAKLGTADIGLTVKRYDEAGVMTITANDDTGMGGLSQSISLGDIASGATKNLNFDQLGIAFSLVNSGNEAVNSESFETKGSAVTSITVESAERNTALFQVGAGVQDTVSLNGFKDIRLTGYNKNDVQSEREAFNNLAAVLADIEANGIDPTETALETAIDTAISQVSAFRSSFGAQQNRLDHAIANVQAQSENLTAANSRIRDTDYAAETANLTKTQIMQQAATAMLAQANQMPNVILALLK